MNLRVVLRVNNSLSGVTLLCFLASQLTIVSLDYSVASSWPHDSLSWVLMVQVMLTVTPKQPIKELHKIICSFHSQVDTNDQLLI